MKLSKYISLVGDSAAAKLFGVTPRCAEAWRLGERSPRPKKAREIEKATKRKVTFSECFEARAA